MSKKVSISISNNLRSSLRGLFRESLNHRSVSCRGSFGQSVWEDEDEYEDMLAYWDRAFPGWDGSDDGEELYPRYEDKRKRKHKKGNGKKHYGIDIPFDGEEDYDVNDCVYSSDFKEIWFYVDYHDKEDRLEFNSIKEFDDYCESMGYYVPPTVAADIEWRYESHCCLCPDSERIGLMEVICGKTYGDMYYEACDEDDFH